jgi:F0F1-type ATP synthase epsilon subunit
VAELLRLVALTPSEALIDAENVEWVHVELVGRKGLTVWPGHAPLVAETAAEVVRYFDHTGLHAVDLPSGILQVEGSTVAFFLAGSVGERVWSQEEKVRLDRLIEMLLTMA